MWHFISMHSQSGICSRTPCPERHHPPCHHTVNVMPPHHMTVSQYGSAALHHTSILHIPHCLRGICR
ncbi:MAG TPA: hypothetical protein DEF41_15175 [Desulfovibrio sp.]|uniref:Uncharacterized protein n=1 Tax=Nitratidesulfovibrio vulgaris (strain ATCC 29579 / DSM 644 / CCUG 34227 / NCIMB 8303 / VKM B-1760 / Hildenborough) TaxID=882 RepID=Q72F69_NITV2|nr:hypothetical protein DVU_0345 [Nitratidesulfovibrio vulgaris str. Hildenborough]HBW17416.1 hypothetical protein [Desulfovibrio sp.]